MSAAPGMFIVRLNRVDVLTLCGVLSSALSAASSIAGRFELAFFLLFLAMLSDAFDGILARKLGLERPFGRYLDGFVDVLAYLVAPSVLLWCWGFNGVLAGLTLVGFVMAGIVRLSVFNEVGNLQEDDRLSYLGMPVFWSTFLVAAAWGLAKFLPSSLVTWGLQLALPAYGVAMVHNGRYWKPKSPIGILLIIGAGLVVFGGLSLRSVLA